MKRLILSFLILLALLLLSACGGDVTGTDAVTTDEATDSDTLSLGTIPDGTPYEPHFTELSVSARELGLIPVRAVTVGETVTCTILADGSVTFTAVEIGHTDVALYDDFGHCVPIQFSVEIDGTLTVGDFTPFTEDGSLNAVLDCGAIPNDETEDTEALRRGIDRLAEEGGGKLYIPRGLYLVKLLEIRDNVELVLAGTVEDATEGYTAALAERVENGEFAVLRSLGGDMIRNFPAKTQNPAGADGFRISGGVFDMQGTSRCILIVRGSDVVFENSILKDCPNNHAIQVTGSERVTMRNLTFAGYNLGTNVTTAEVLQVEAAANGATGGDLATYGDGEFYPSRDILIEDCYFGRSDRFGPPHIAIGHHGARSESDCTGLTVTGCLFDDCSLYAIKIYAFSGVRITENRFVSTEDNRISDAEATFIHISLANKKVTAKQPRADTGETVTATLAMPYGLEGAHGIEIADNDFSLSGETLVRRVIVAESNAFIPGAESVKELWRFSTYGGKATLYSGYLPVRNYIEDVTVRGNRIAVTCTEAELDDALIVMRFVVGVTLEDNAIESTLPFTESAGGVPGILLYECLTGIDASTREIRMQPFTDDAIGVLLPRADGSTACVTATAALSLSLGTDGNGELLLKENADGSLTVECRAKDGYVFHGWVRRDGGTPEGLSDEVSLSSPLALTAVFTRSAP